MAADVLEAVILGCGSSAGVPRLGGADGSGEWGACDPQNPKNRRRRCSLLLRRGQTAVLVDTSPDLREQLLATRLFTAGRSTDDPSPCRSDQRD